MFTIDMLPAEYGDCLWIEYGDPARPKRVLIDGGTARTASVLAARIRKVTEREGSCRFELVVLTHVDADHVEGLLRLFDNLRHGRLSFEVGDIWLNGRAQLPEDDAEPVDFGALQAEMFSAVLARAGLPLLRWTAGEPIVVPPQGALPVCDLAGGLRLTVLGPTTDRLAELRRRWDREVEAWMDREQVDSITPEALLAALAERRESSPLTFSGEVPSIDELRDIDMPEDDSEPNGSSIVLLAEYEGRSCLLAGDAFARDVTASLSRLRSERHGDRLSLGVFKLAHHGSRANLSEDLLEQFDCETFLVSTNGARYDHPDPETIALVVGGGPRRDASYRRQWPARLGFNYAVESTLHWRRLSEAEALRWSFSALYSAGEGLLVRI